MEHTTAKAVQHRMITHADDGVRRPRRHFITALVLIGALARMPNAYASRPDLWSVEGKAPDAVVVSLVPSPQPPPRATKSYSPMHAAVLHIASTATGSDLTALKACIQLPVPDARVPPSITPQYWLTLWSKDASARLVVLKDATGEWFVQPSSDDPAAAKQENAPTFRLSREKFARLRAQWPTYRGGWTDLAADPKPMEVSRLASPLLPGDITFDRVTMDKRVFFRSTNIEGSSRVLANEAMWIRLPKEHSPRRPSGLLIWIDAMPDGRPQAPFNESLDALNIIAVGASNAGNERPLADRMQLAFDALATCESRFHIDQRRVYLSGISGGGRVSSMLAIEFPERFSGCIPIVGLNSFEAVDLPNGKRIGATYGRPSAALLKSARTTRLAPITGPEDFNYDEILARAKGLSAAGVNLKMFDIPGLAHQLPRSKDLNEAFAWVDAPEQAAKHEREQTAVEAWKKCESSFGSAKIVSEQHRTSLEALCSQSPWTPQAWLAIDLLNTDSDAAPKKSSNPDLKP